MPNMDILEDVWDTCDRNWLRKKFEKQLNKLETDTFDRSLNFEKIKISAKHVFYSFRVNWSWRWYCTKQNGVFTVFDLNNHDYESIKRKVRAMK